METSVSPFGNRDADIHVLDFVPPLVFAGPPHAGPFFFAGRKDPRATGGILLKDEAAEATDRRRRAGIVKLDRIGFPILQRLREVDEDRVGLPFVLQLRRVEQNLVDAQDVAQVDLNSCSIPEHLEANRVLAGDGFLLGIDPHVEVVIHEVVILAIRTVGSAQQVALFGCHGHALSTAAPPARLRDCRSGSSRLCRFLLRGLGQNLGAANRDQTDKPVQKANPRATRSESAA